MGFTAAAKGNVNTGQIFYIVVHLLRKHGGKKRQYNRISLSTMSVAAYKEIEEMT